jgi:hypothetical protein
MLHLGCAIKAAAGLLVLNSTFVDAVFHYELADLI